MVNVSLIDPSLEVEAHPAFFGPAGGQSWAYLACCTPTRRFVRGIVPATVGRSLRSTLEAMSLNISCGLLSARLPSTRRTVRITGPRDDVLQSQLVLCFACR